MSTDVTRGPKVCPSCGQENPPTAARCWLCFTPLGGAFQTTTAPSPRETRLSAPSYTQPTAGPRSGCATVGVWIGIAILALVSAGVTFVLVCSAPAVVGVTLPKTPPKYDDFLMGMSWLVAYLAPILVATLVIVAFVRRRRR
jgi:hypothetical protein